MRSVRERLTQETRDWFDAQDGRSILADLANRPFKPSDDADDEEPLIFTKKGARDAG